MEKQDTNNEVGVSVIPRVTVVINIVSSDEKDLALTKESIKQQNYPEIDYLISNDYPAEEINKACSNSDFVCILASGDEFYNKSVIDDIVKDFKPDTALLYGDTVVEAEGHESPQYLPPYKPSLTDDGYMVMPIFAQSKLLKSIQINKKLKFLISHDILKKLMKTGRIRHIAEKLFKVPTRQVDIKEDILNIDEDKQNAQHN